MKISKYFVLPVNIEKIHLCDTRIARQPFVGDGGECQAVNHAVNNHDALVELLTKITPKIEYTPQLYCGGCHNFMGGKIKIHGEGCVYQEAINLLDKINGEKP